MSYLGLLVAVFGAPLVASCLLSDPFVAVTASTDRMLQVEPTKLLTTSGDKSDYFDGPYCTFPYILV